MIAIAIVVLGSSASKDLDTRPFQDAQELACSIGIIATNLKLVPCTSLPGLLLLPRKMSQLLRHGSKKRNWLHRMRPCRVNLVRRLRYMVIQLS